MPLRISTAVLAALALSACATTVHGPARLIGQELDAATQLYGPWADRVERKGRQVYVWRRAVALTNGERRFCELRVSLGFRDTIGKAEVEGAQDACRLFDVRYESVTR